MNRTLNVVRLQFVNKQTFVWVPLLVLAGALAVSLVFFALIPNEVAIYGGAGQAPLWYLFAVGIQALTMTFPFSQALSITRRDFFVGTLAAAMLSAAALSVVFVVIGLAEQATAGFGTNGYVIWLPWVWASGPLGAGLLYLVLGCGFFLAGLGTAVIYKRFGVLILTTVLIAAGLLLAIAIALLTVRGGWIPMFEWFAQTGVVTIAVAGLPVLAVLAWIDYALLRRAVP